MEENRLAVSDGNAALRLNEAARSRCRFVARSVEAALAALRHADAVVLDPPREGCSAPVLRDLFRRLRPARVVCVSCNPEVLGAELGTIGSCGYRIGVAAAGRHVPAYRARRNRRDTRPS